MKASTVILVGAAAACALASGAAMARKAPATPPPLGPAPQAIAGARQGSMIMAANTLSTVSNALKTEAPAKSVAFAVSGLAKWAEHIPSQFAPNTSGLAGTRARPEVWSNRQEFLNKATDLALAADGLLAAARADDRAALAAALESTKAACQSCHQTFQLPAPVAKPG